MKSIITLSAITILATLALAGCNQNTSDSSTSTPATNSSINPANGTGGGTNNLPAMNTNLPATTN
jgi:hypothetical protein